MRSPDGTGFFIKGVAGWNIHTQLSDADQAFFLDDCVAKGVNAVMVMLFDHFYTKHVPTDAHGNAPFTKAGDFSTPNAAYFTNFKRVLQMFLDRNMLMVLAPMYAGAEFTSPKQGWADEMRSNGSAKMRALGQYIETQFAAYPNIIYQHMGDNSASDLLPLAYSMAQGISDVNASRMHTAHLNGGSGGDHSPRDVFAPASSYPAINLNLIYTYYGELEPTTWMADLMHTQWNRTPAWPVYKAEDRYLDDGVADAYMTRWQTYQAILGGACGNFTGVNPIWYFGGVGNATTSATWQQQLSAPGYVQAIRASSLLTAHAWHLSSPDTANTFLTGGVSSGSSRAVARRADDGTWAMVYAPSARTLVFDMTKLSRSVAVSWVDPTSGTRTAIGTKTNSGSLSIATPGSNASGNSDWVLLFE